MIKKLKAQPRTRILAGTILALFVFLALAAGPIQSSLSGYFVQKTATERNLQSIIESQDAEFRSVRGDWFGGLKVIVDCDTYNKIASKSDGRYPAGQCFGSANVLYTDYMVKELPPLPKDFYLVREALFIDPLIKRIPFDVGKYGENYWKQPEWVVPFEEQKVPVIRKYIEDPSYGVVWGVGTWDDKIVKVTKPPVTENDIEETIYAWIEPVPTTTGHLGVGLRKVYPSVAEFSEDNTELKSRYFQSQELAEKYIDLKIEPDELLLEPNFPYFHDGYRAMIKVTLTIKKDTPTGIYLVGMQPDRPSKEFSEKHRAENLAGYWDPYLGFARIGTPYQIFVEVNVG